jgi:hypothetical protein
VKNVAKREGGTAWKGRGQIRPTACPGGGVLKRVTGMGELGSKSYQSKGMSVFIYFVKSCTSTSASCPSLLSASMMGSFVYE